MPLTEPQVPANPVTPQPPLPPAAVDGFLRYAQIGSQLLHREQPVRAAHGSRVPGSPVPGRCTLASSRPVKPTAVSPSAGHRSLRPAGVHHARPMAAEGQGSRAVASGAALLLAWYPIRSRAGEQDGLACRPGPASSSANSARHVKPAPPAGHLPGMRHGAVCLANGGTARRDPVTAGVVSAVRAGQRARAPHAPAPAGEMPDPRRRGVVGAARGADRGAVAAGQQHQVSGWHQELGRSATGVRALQFVHEGSGPACRTKPLTYRKSGFRACFSCRSRFSRL